MRVFLVAAVAVLASPSAVLAAQPYEGKWVTQQSHCNPRTQKERDDAIASDATVVIKGKRLEAHESSCEIKSVSRKGDTWTFNARCEGEGEVWSRKITMNVHGDTALIDGTNQLLRCPRR